MEQTLGKSPVLRESVMELYLEQKVDRENRPQFSRYIHQNPVKAGLVSLAEEYQYSSWPNDYLSKASQPICHTQSVISRYGIDELTEWVNNALAENACCLDINERKIVADETIRKLILKKCGAENITNFQLFSKERQKDIVRDVMMELGAGPRQMSRVSGLSYTQFIKRVSNIKFYNWQESKTCPHDS